MSQLNVDRPIVDLIFNEKSQISHYSIIESEKRRQWNEKNETQQQQCKKHIESNPTHSVAKAHFVLKRTQETMSSNFSMTSWAPTPIVHDTMNERRRDFTLYTQEDNYVKLIAK